MRVVLVGASSLTVATTRRLLKNGHEVVIVESSQDRIDTLSEELDCGFIHGDGSRPATLKEVSPENTDFLFCLSDDDQDNIIAGLVGRQLEFGRVVSKIEDEDFQEVCVQLGLEDTILPDREVGRTLVEMVEGKESAGLTAVVKEGVRFFATVVGEKSLGQVGDLKLPQGAQVVVVTRDERSRIANSEIDLQEGDELLIITHDEHMDELRQRFQQHGSASGRLSSAK